MEYVMEDEFDSSSDDEVVEIQANPVTRRLDINNILNDTASPRRAPRPQRQREEVASEPRRVSRAPVSQQEPTAVIDLTEEPDSPDQPASTSQASRNPRRTNSQRLSPPRLARSDNTLFGPMTSIIDLTDDPPDDGRDRGFAPHIHLRHRPHHHHHHHAPRHHHHLGHDQLIGLELRRNGFLVSGIARGMQQITGLLQNELFRGNFNPPVGLPAPYSPREASPKPPMEEVPPTREGFTRDTCATADDGDERVVVCPACNDELAYDPADAASASSSKKRKRAPGEHHFWALKKCGHVYCADCFENRKPSKTSPNGVGFRCSAGKTPLSAPTDLRCAVDGCETKILQKQEWVGIFL